ncbi:hypothetical protein FM115_09765 [Marinilactibacillus psychrotolerans 42ea]|nr:hypothetical protein FM115_09765 [Marinilactibacillus psychrotolerans 42ea]
MVVQVTEFIVKLVNINKAKYLKELIQNRRLSKFSSYFYIVGIAILTGALI